MTTLGGRSKKDLEWKGLAMGAATAAGILTNRLRRLAWIRTKKTEPPANPAARSTTWPDALAWAAASGVALGVAKLVAQRGAAAAWKAKTGGYPKALSEAA
jgi:hypothetical protein